MQKIRSYIAIIAGLIKTDFKTFSTEYVGKVVDTAIWIVISMVVTKYVLPALGIPLGYSIIAFAGIIASAPLMETYPNSLGLAADLIGPRTIYYDLILPLHSWMIPLQRAISFALRSAAVGIFILPIGKLLLWQELDFAAIAWGKLIICFIVGNIFSGFFALFLGTTVKNLVTDHTWMRLVFPLWFLGGFQFNWYSLYKTWPTLAYLDLLNPFIYVTESTRVAVLGQENHLPFWWSIAALLLFSLFFGYLGIIRVKKQLDFV